MNSISWFVYWANVVDNAGSVLGPLAVLSLLVTVVALIAFVVISFGAKSEDDDCIKVRPYAKTIFGWCLTVWLVCVGSYIFVPNKNTMYAIAASQVGEQVINSETVRGMTNDATKALQQWIKKQIDPEAKK